MRIVLKADVSGIMGGEVVLDQCYDTQSWRVKPKPPPSVLQPERVSIMVFQDEARMREKDEQAVVQFDVSVLELLAAAKAFEQVRVCVLAKGG